MKKRMRSWVTMVLFLCILVSSCLPLQADAEEKITPSNVFYDIVLRDKSFIFIGNKTEVDWKVGDSYFLTYTVKSCEADGSTQSGMMVTPDRDAAYPYLDGTMYLAQKALFLEEGYTYFFRFDVTEDGFQYTAGKAKGEESSYIKLPGVYKDVKTRAPYFGIWIGEGTGATAELTKVQCYDKNGKDLGVYAPKASTITISEMVEKEVNHSYAFSLNKHQRVAFGNARKTKSDVVFLEYKISNVEATDVDQSGVEMTNAPTAEYPHADKMGYLNLNPHKSTEECQLITEGAKYLIRFERGEKSFDALVRRTMPNGKVDYFCFPYYAGTYNPDFNYFIVWIGNLCHLTADFTEVKCYDDAGNNLGIQTNRGVKVEHFGDLEDYSQCEAVYYCEENDTYIALEDDCVASKRIDGEANAEMGTYSIANSVLTVKLGKETQTFDYLYEYFTDKAGNKYVRLREWDVTYMSSKYDGDVLDVITVSAENGFKVNRPEDPKKDGREFLGWVKGNGEEYDFNKVVTDATTLYALWNGDEEWTLTNFLEANGVTATTAIAVVSVVCVLMVAGTVVGIVLLRKRKKVGNE